MKSFLTKIRNLILVFAVILLFNDGEDICASQAKNLSIDTLNIFCSAGLNELVNIWTEEFTSLNPGLKFIVSASGDIKQINSNTLGIVADNEAGMKIPDAGTSLIIGHNAVVAVFNSGNPSVEAIVQQGITAKEIARLLTSFTRWDEIITGANEVEVKLFITENKEAEMLLNSFCQIDISDNQGIKSNRTSDVIQAVSSDIYAIGFCMLHDLKKSVNAVQEGSVRLLPLDKNSNGRIDYFEDIYSNIETLTRGMWIGKYPKALCGNICAIIPEKSPDNSINAFLLWIMSDGGKYLTSSGFGDLTGHAKESNISIITGMKASSVLIDEPGRTGLWVFLFALAALTGILVLLIFGAKRKIRSIPVPGAVVDAHPLNEGTVNVMKGVYFDKSHTWSYMEKDGNVRIGIDDFLQHVTGTLTKIKFKEPGDHVRRGEKIFTIIRNGKQIDIHSPISGIIRERNVSLIEDSSAINREPFGDGWVYLIEPVNWEKEIRFMFMSEKYQEWIKDEILRLREFFGIVLRPGKPAYSQVILQDGGELVDNVLSDMEPEVWEEFQRNFIDKSV